MKYTILSRAKPPRTPEILKKVFASRQEHFPDVDAASRTIWALCGQAYGYRRYRKFGSGFTQAEFDRFDTDDEVFVSIHAQARNLIALANELLRVAELWRGRRDLSAKVWLVEDPAKPMKLALAANMGPNLAVRVGDSMIIAPIEGHNPVDLAAELARRAI